MLINYNSRSKIYACFNILFFGLAMLVNFSCKKSYDAELNKGDTRLILSVSKDSMSLKQVNETADAFVFNWTSGSNKGTNSSIAYTLKIDKKGNNFKNPQIEQLDKGVLTKKYTVKDFNALLLNKWNSSPDTAVNLEAKIIASVSDKTVPADSSNIISFTAKPYAPVTGNLYLIGDATPNGWDANSATPLSAIIGQPGKFSWQGNLKSGDLKFITTLTQFLPSYNKGSSNTSLFYRTDNAQPDDKFNISIPGNYVVTVDLLNLTINIATGNLPPYTQLWIVGSATPNGWDINNPNKMIVDSSNLFVFNYNEILAAGEFKMPTSTGNWGADFYMPLTDHPALTETGVHLVPGGSPDFKWQITNAGPYKIKLDLQKNLIHIMPFTPYTQIWMVGDATPVGWNINSPQPMTPDPNNPYLFSYSGPMNPGEFKFPVATGNWGGDFFMPVIDQSGPGSAQMKFVPGGSPDYKWRLTQAGNYTITIDQLRETISIVKL